MMLWTPKQLHFCLRVSCPDGSKFVVKQVGFHNQLQAPSLWLMQAKGVRKQFLVLDGESVLAFVAKKSDQNNAVKFSQCSSYRFSLSSRMIGSHLSYCRDITHDVVCKPVEGAAGLSLNSKVPAPAPAPPGLDLDLESSPGEINNNLTLQLFIFPSSPSYAPMSTEWWESESESTQMFLFATIFEIWVNICPPVQKIWFLLSHSSGC